MRPLDLGQISYLLAALARLEQVRRQIRPADVDAEALDQTTTFDDGAPGLPKRTPLAPAWLGLALCRESKRAVLGVDLAHAWSVDRRRRGDIGPSTDLTAAFY